MTIVEVLERDGQDQNSNDKDNGKKNGQKSYIKSYIKSLDMEVHIL